MTTWGIVLLSAMMVIFFATGIELGWHDFIPFTFYFLASYISAFNGFFPNTLEQKNKGEVFAILIRDLLIVLITLWYFWKVGVDVGWIRTAIVCGVISFLPRLLAVVFGMRKEFRNFSMLISKLRVLTFSVLGLAVMGEKITALNAVYTTIVLSFFVFFLDFFRFDQKCAHKIMSTGEKPSLKRRENRHGDEK